MYSEYIRLLIRSCCPSTAIATIDGERHNLNVAPAHPTRFTQPKPAYLQDSHARRNNEKGKTQDHDRQPNAVRIRDAPVRDHFS